MTTSRRAFIRQIALALAAGGVTVVPLSAQSNKQRKGIILGTLEKQMREDLDKTLTFLKSVGYEELEYPGTFGHTAALLKKKISDVGLLSIAGGDSMATIQKNADQMFAEYNLLNKEYLVCYWPWMDNGKNKTIDDWKRNCEVFNKLGSRCKAAGIKLAYHNHNIEFEVLQGETPYTVLLENTDPELVVFEIDFWWVVKGGRDPISFLTKYPDRFKLCHIKSYDVFMKTDPKVNYESIIKSARDTGLHHYIIENEGNIPNPIDYAEKSINYLDSLLTFR